MILLKDFSIVASINYEKLDKYKEVIAMDIIKQLKVKIVNDYDLLFFDQLEKKLV